MSENLGFELPTVIGHEVQIEIRKVCGLPCHMSIELSEYGYNVYADIIALGLIRSTPLWHNRHGQYDLTVTKQELDKAMNVVFREANLAGDQRVRQIVHCCTHYKDAYTFDLLNHSNKQMVERVWAAVLADKKAGRHRTVRSLLNANYPTLKLTGKIKQRMSEVW